VRVIVLVSIVAATLTTACSQNCGLNPTEPKPSRQQVLFELHKNAPTLQLRELTALPDPSLPELSEHFAARAAHHPWLFGHLLARYGTGSVLKKVREIYNPDHLRWGCDSRFPFLAYFLRVDRTEGIRVLRAALRERIRNGCFRSMLSRVSRIVPEADIEAVAIDALDDADPLVGADAAMTLSSYGSAAAEPYLWRTLYHWTVRWRNRPLHGLSGDPGTFDGGQYGEVRLGDSLRGAIQNAQAWYFDEARRRHLYALCWTEHCRSQFEERSPPPAVRVRVHQLMDDEPRIEVGWYHPKPYNAFAPRSFSSRLGQDSGGARTAKVAEN
jgi:hypothetical protein